MLRAYRKKGLNPFTTAGLDILCRHTQKSICRKTKRATADLKLRTKSSRRGASTSAGHRFISSVFGELFLIIDKNALKIVVRFTVGCASSKALMRMFQELLKCLSLAANFFFRKPSCRAFGQKSISLVKNCFGGNTIRTLSTSDA